MTDKEKIEMLESQLKNLRDEIESAHVILTKLGAGKEHWSLGGRIHSLYIVLKGLTPQQAALDPKLEP